MESLFSSSSSSTHGRRNESDSANGSFQVLGSSNTAGNASTPVVTARVLDGFPKEKGGQTSGLLSLETTHLVSHNITTSTMSSPLSSSSDAFVAGTSGTRTVPLGKAQGYSNDHDGNFQSSSSKTPLSCASFSHGSGLKFMGDSGSSSNRVNSASGLDPILSYLFPVINNICDSTVDNNTESNKTCADGTSFNRKKRSHPDEASLPNNSNFPIKRKKSSNLKCDQDDEDDFDDVREYSVSELVEEAEPSTGPSEDNGTVRLRNASRSGMSNAILGALPREVLEHCLSFLDCLRDRSNTSRTCKVFNTIMLTPQMLRDTILFDICTTTHDNGKEENHDGIVTVIDHNDRQMISFVNEDEDTKVLLRRLGPFLEAGNIHAMYIAGMISIYCHDDVMNGISWLEAAADHDFDEALYSLGIITRDAQRERSTELMTRAHKMGFFPATMEIMNARELREVHGEPSADALRVFLGPTSLHRLIRRYFCDVSKFRSHSSSHCWNPLCGRWAYKYPREHVAAMQQSNISVYERSSTAGAAGGAGSSMPRHGNSSKCPPKCARMKMCSSCRRAKYCSKICQVYDWRSGRHKLECQFIG